MIVRFPQRPARPRACATTRLAKLDGRDFEKAVEYATAGDAPTEAIRKVKHENIVARTAVSMQPYVAGDSGRSIVVYRHSEKRQWALHARPAPDLPAAETVFFAPLPAELDEHLTMLSHDEVREHLLDCDYLVDDIDVRLDMRLMGEVWPRLWSHQFRDGMSGWTRVGYECGLEQGAAA